MCTEHTPKFQIAGPPDAPLVIVLGGISATRHVCATKDDPTPGWWDGVVGPGRTIDPSMVRVLSVDYVDGGRGTDGRPQRTVTTHEQADVVCSVLDLLDVECAHAFVGASYGGMVGLAFAERYPARLSRLVAISAPHEPHPMSTALRALQRRIVAFGIDTGESTEALSIARGLAMTTYRSAREFGARFDSAPVVRSPNDALFPVDGYLRHHGDRFATTWSPERFLALSLSLDLHRVDPAAIRTPTVIVAAEGDTIVPRAQLELLADHLGAPNRFVELQSLHGHDAFLTEPHAICAVLDSALSLETFS